tara:strand:+ start:90 stop:485 length:396 start_codon:yes stop_codon:yes gene_type:complete
MTKPQIVGMTEFNDARNSPITEAIAFTANLFTLRIPGFNVDSGNQTISLLGKTRTTVISGEYTGSESQIKAFRQEIEGEQDDLNQSQKEYTSSDGDTFDILISDSNFVRDLRSAEIVTYTISLLTSDQLFS